MKLNHIFVLSSGLVININTVQLIEADTFAVYYVHGWAQNGYLKKHEHEELVNEIKRRQLLPSEPENLRT